MSEDKGRVESILEFRGNFLELIIVAIAIGLAINLVAGLLSNILPNWWSAAISAILIFTGCTILALRISPRINRRLSLNGVVIVQKDPKKIVDIDRYRFSYEVSRWFRALFKENKALEQIWTSSEVEYDFGIGAAAKNERSQSKKLIGEAIEYFALRRLTLDLSTHFNNAGLDTEELIFLERNDVPAVLLSNRFLDLLSRPVEERISFSPDRTQTTTGEENEGFATKTVYMVTSDGAIFEHFELVLPKGSRVTRPESQTIQIETKRFLLKLQVRFDGTNDSLPREFEELYLGLRFGDVDVYRAGIDVDIKFRLRSLLSQKGWEYFSWIDIFLTTLKQDFSLESFFDRIGWEVAHSVAIVTRVNNSNRRQKPRPPLSARRRKLPIKKDRDRDT